ncbi:hypothetical protein IQ62_08750 [Streptomyces scabiei]|nr:hypothetical protein IQ62_08750 [Streptomyces scabiei]
MSVCWRYRAAHAAQRRRETPRRMLVPGMRAAMNAVASVCDARLPSVSTCCARSRVEGIFGRQGRPPGPWIAMMREVNERVKLDLVFVDKLLTFMIRGSLRGPPGRIRRAHGVSPAPASASVA